MQTIDYPARTTRRGFTLIEMIVVMGILLVLATMLVALIGSPILVQDKARRGGSQLQQWFRIAKTRAIADGVPRGLRLVGDSDNPNLVRQLLYIEQPNDFVVMLPALSANIPATQRRLFITAQGNGTSAATLDPNPPNFPSLVQGQYDFTGGLGLAPQDKQNWPVQAVNPVVLPGPPPLTVFQPGDYLEIGGGGLLHRIIGVSADTLTLASTPPNLASPPVAIAQWRVIRQPRVLKGETPLLLPQDVAVDLTKCYPPQSPAGSSDILFASSGRVLGALGSQDRVVLWVRDVTRDTPYDNNPVLVSIHARTGFIAVHPVDVSNSPASDFNFTLDGRLSGM
jgi:prepilin-type N-terminal cleavage/methylation domain-containing protein